MRGVLVAHGGGLELAGQKARKPKLTNGSSDIWEGFNPQSGSSSSVAEHKLRWAVRCVARGKAAEVAHRSSCRVQRDFDADPTYLWCHFPSQRACIVQSCLEVVLQPLVSRSMVRGALAR